MSYALTRYTADGSQTTYTIGFTYRDTADVVVKVAGVTQTLTTHYTFPSSSQITFGTAPTNGQAILIQRSTSQSSRLVDYTAGSVLKEADLDADSIQSFNMSQEAIDIANESITKDATGVFTASSTRITNVTDPTSAQDAATKNYVDTGSSSQVVAATAQATNSANSATASANSATASANSATASANSATASANSASAASTSESNASTSASTSSTQATNSANSATASANSATASAGSASTASTQASNASTSATLSGNYANKTDGAVAGSEYSSKAWALGGTGVTDTAGSGGAKEWATDTTNQVDGTEYSAKEYAIGSQSGNTSGSAKQWAIGGGGSYATNTTVDGSNYSAKYWAEVAASHADAVDDIYLGSKSSNPTVDNDGNTLQVGALFYHSGSTVLRVWNGSAWEDAVVSTSGFASAGFSIAMSIAL